MYNAEKCKNAKTACEHPFKENICTNEETGWRCLECALAPYAFERPR